jgi:hypothetical protein
VAALYDVPLLDFDKVMVKLAPNHIPGHNLFRDHCHLKGWVTNVQLSAFYKVIMDNFTIE